MDPANSAHRATASSPPPDVAMPDIAMTDRSPNPDIEDIRQQALARRPQQAEGGKGSKAARHSKEDAICTFIIFLERLKRFPTENPGNKFSELAEKMTQQPLQQKDIPRLLAILHRDNLAIFKKVSPLPDSTKKALLTLAAKLLQFRVLSASPKDDADTHLKKSLPYQTLLPVLSWLFEVQTPQLPQEYEEALAAGLVIFSFDSCEGFSGPVSCKIFDDEALPLVSAARMLLPAAGSRLAALPLTPETIVPVIALLALHHREEVWNVIPKLPVESSACLQNKLKTIAEPETCCTLLAELARIQDIWYFPPVEGSLLRDILDMLSKGSRMIPAQNFEMALMGFEATFSQESPDQFLRQYTQGEHVVSLLNQLIPQLGTKMRLSVEGLASLFRLVMPHDIRASEKWIESILLSVQHFDGEKRARPSLVLTTVLQDLLIIGKICDFTFQDIQGLFDHLVCQFLLAPRDYDQMYLFFKVLGILTDFKPRPILSQTVEDSLSRWYQSKQTDISVPVSQSAHDQNPTPEYVKLYGLLVLAQFLPAERYQRLTTPFIRDHLHVDIVNRLDTSQSFSILLRELLLTMSQLQSVEEEFINPTLTLLRDFLISSLISPDCASQIYSHHLLLSTRYVLNRAPEDDDSACFFIREMCRLAKRDVLPPLTAAASEALQKLLAEHLNDYDYIHKNLDQFVKHPKLKLLLPKNPALYATFIHSWTPPTAHQPDAPKVILKHWQAVHSLVKAGFLAGLDADNSMFLRGQVCDQLNRLLQKDSLWSIEVTSCIHAALEALIQDGCLDRFHPDMSEEQITNRKKEMQQLFELITKKEQSFTIRLT